MHTLAPCPSGHHRALFQVKLSMSPLVLDKWLHSLQVCFGLVAQNNNRLMKHLATSLCLLWNCAEKTWLVSDVREGVTWVVDMGKRARNSVRILKVETYSPKRNDFCRQARHRAAVCFTGRDGASRPVARLLWWEQQQQHFISQCMRLPQTILPHLSLTHTYTQAFIIKPLCICHPTLQPHTPPAEADHLR